MFEFKQIEITPMSMIYFTYPEEIAGCSDVRIAVEYVRSDYEPELVYCWVWAQIADKALRGEIENFQVPYSPDSGEQEQDIISALSASQTFRPTLESYLNKIQEIFPSSDK